MSRFLAEPAHRHGSPARTGVVLINLGTPDEPSPPAVRRYLREFLADPRVVEIPRPVWWLILNALVLPFRPRRSAEKYAAVWTVDGSPLKVHVARQAKLLRGFLGQSGHRVLVDHAMRYGDPSIPATLSRLKEAGCTRILVLPLYPQYSASTTASALDAVGDWLKRVRNQPEVRTVRGFADHPGYIEALAASVREHWAKHGKPDRSYRLLISFHGLPRYTLDRGDPYHCECRKTARLLTEALGLTGDACVVCFQSRFGRAEWLQPYTAATIRSLGEQRVRRVDVICPGFTADCLETLEEIAIEGQAEFLRAGGTEFRLIPCLNERADWIRALADLAASQLAGWPTLGDADSAVLELSALRAKALGAPS